MLLSSSSFKYGPSSPRVHCPNHHAILDKGSFSIHDVYKLAGEEQGELIVHPNHHLDPNSLAYHRKTHGY